MANELTIDHWKKQLAEMSHEDLARLYRFAPAGHPVFNSELTQLFFERFNELGGMTRAISKKIGWDPHTAAL